MGSDIPWLRLWSHFKRILNVPPVPVVIWKNQIRSLVWRDKNAAGQLTPLSPEPNISPTITGWIQGLRYDIYERPLRDKKAYYVFS